MLIDFVYFDDWISKIVYVCGFINGFVFSCVFCEVYGMIFRELCDIVGEGCVNYYDVVYENFFVIMNRWLMGFGFVGC